MDDFITNIGIIGFTSLSIIFAGLSGYLFLKRRSKHTNNNSSGTAQSDRESKIDYTKLEQLFKDSIKILSKKDNGGSDNSNSN